MVLFLRWSFYRGGHLVGFHCTFSTVYIVQILREGAGIILYRHSQTLQQQQRGVMHGREGKCGGSKKGS